MLVTKSRESTIWLARVAPIYQLSGVCNIDISQLWGLRTATPKANGAMKSCGPRNRTPSPRLRKRAMTHRTWRLVPRDTPKRPSSSSGPNQLHPHMYGGGGIAGGECDDSADRQHHTRRRFFAYIHLRLRLIRPARGRWPNGVSCGASLHVLCIMALLRKRGDGEGWPQLIMVAFALWVVALEPRI